MLRMDWIGFRIEIHYFRSFSLASPSMQTHISSHGYYVTLPGPKEQSFAGQDKEGPAGVGRENGAVVGEDTRTVQSIKSYFFFE